MPKLNPANTAENARFEQFHRALWDQKGELRRSAIVKRATTIPREDLTSFVEDVYAIVDTLISEHNGRALISDTLLWHLESEEETVQFESIPLKDCSDEILIRRIWRGTVKKAKDRLRSRYEVSGVRQAKERSSALKDLGTPFAKIIFECALDDAFTRLRTKHELSAFYFTLSPLIEEWAFFISSFYALSCYKDYSDIPADSDIDEEKREKRRLKLNTLLKNFHSERIAKAFKVPQSQVQAAMHFIMRQKPSSGFGSLLASDIEEEAPEPSPAFDDDEETWR